MQAIQGTYNNGTFTLNSQAPVKTGKIIVVFEGVHEQNTKSESIKNLLLPPTLDTKNWRFNREEANAR
jgi:hypothetical protein